MPPLGWTKPKEILHPVGPSIAYVQLTRGDWALIDSSDIELVSQFSWRSDPTLSGCYARSQRPTEEGKRRLITMHGLIAGGSFPMVDHRNRRTLDNRRCNLRPATRAQNTRNSRIRKDSNSGVKGVRLAKGKWVARIRQNGTRLHLGTFDTKQEAAEAYNAAAKVLHGEFAS